MTTTDNRARFWVNLRLTIDGATIEIPARDEWDAYHEAALHFAKNPELFLSDLEARIYFMADNAPVDVGD